jgi:ubiquitin carboxyl-terminal hydrolase 34
MRLNCKDYFLLLNNLVTKFGPGTTTTVHHLLDTIFAEMRTRDYHEQPIVTGTQESYQEDDVLIGLLSLATSLLKHLEDMSDGEQATMQEDTHRLLKYIDELYDYLFELRTSSDGLYKIQLPKLRSNVSRSLGFDLLLEFAKLSPRHYTHVYEKMMARGGGVSPSTPSATGGRAVFFFRHFNKNLNQIVCDYWPKDDVKSPCGYVGLVNLGATCYMATAMQHLFMINEARQCILNTVPNANAGNGLFWKKI